MPKMSVEQESSWKYNKILQKKHKPNQSLELGTYIYIRATVLYVVKTKINTDLDI